MSTHRNRTMLDTSQDGREYKIRIINELYPPYWDEGLNFYPKWKKGFVNPNRQLLAHEVRMYRSWKHNRKTQYKH